MRAGFSTILPKSTRRMLPRSGPRFSQSPEAESRLALLSRPWSDVPNIALTGPPVLALLDVQNRTARDAISSPRVPTHSERPMPAFGRSTLPSDATRRPCPTPVARGATSNPERPKACFSIGSFAYEPVATRTSPMMTQHPRNGMVATTIDFRWPPSEVGNRTGVVLVNRPPRCSSFGNR